VWRMCSADDDMTRCSRLYRTSCTLLLFVFCQLPMLVRGKTGVLKGCVSECVCMCEWRGWRPTGHRPILFQFLMQIRESQIFLPLTRTHKYIIVGE